MDNVLGGHPHVAGDHDPVLRGLHDQNVRGVTATREANVDGTRRRRVNGVCERTDRGPPFICPTTPIHTNGMARRPLICGHDRSSLHD
ncbi:MAG: hypothetical protein AB7H93_00830 [Vicinamibacterales bacterium]